MKLLPSGMKPVLQSCLPFAPWADPVARKLPGVRPAELADWIVTDDAFASQMRLRDDLIARRPQDVLRLDARARPAAEELRDMAVEALLAKPGYSRIGDVLHRPDGQDVDLAGDDVMATIGRLCQDDFCLLDLRGPEHVLCGAVLCFPASWTLAQKFLRPLIGIHEPVASYDPDIAKRVQRLFDAIRPDQVLWRANALLYAEADLYQPRVEGEGRPRPGRDAPFVRSERQSLRRLPKTGAVVFSIHTYVVRRESLTSAQEAALIEHLPGASLAP